MASAATIKFIEKELRDLAISNECDAYTLIREEAIDAADVLNRVELRAYISDYADSLPLHLFK